MNAEPTLRPAGPEDVDILVLLHGASFRDAWSRQVLAPSLAMPGSFAFLATQDGQPAGFVLARVHAGEGEIMTLCVVPGSRRVGVGRALVAATIEKAKSLGAIEIFLEVAENNVAAIELYRSFEFIEVGRRGGYYEYPEGQVDAYVFRLPLNPV